MVFNRFSPEVTKDYLGYLHGCGALVGCVGKGVVVYFVGAPTKKMERSNKKNNKSRKMWKIFPLQLPKIKLKMKKTRLKFMLEFNKEL